MRTCPAFSLCSHLAYYGRRGAGHDLALLGASVHSRLYATTTIAHKAPSTPPVLKSPFATQPHDRLGHASTLTALHKARELVTRVLPPQSPELLFWNDILRDVSDQTSRSSLTFDKEKITIVGMSEVPIFKSELRSHVVLCSVLCGRVFWRRNTRKCSASRPFLAGGGECTDRGSLGRP